MIRRNHFYIATFMLGVITACSPTTQPSSSSRAYEEDLSPYRPQVTVSQTAVPMETQAPEVEYVAPTNHLQTEIDSVIRIKSARNQEVGFLNGFTIQVYSGRSREQANAAKYNAREILDGEEPQLYYDQPRFRVKIGQYYSRLEAEKSLNLLKKRFRQALILPEKIPLSE